MELPTTTVGLIAFLTAAYLGGTGYLVRYFLNAQKKQTDIYMEYIQTKNGHLEKARESFGKMINEARMDFSNMLSSQGERHKQMIDDATARLEACQISTGKIVKKKSKKK